MSCTESYCLMGIRVSLKGGYVNGCQHAQINRVLYGDCMRNVWICVYKYMYVYKTYLTPLCLAMMTLPHKMGSDLLYNSI